MDTTALMKELKSASRSYERQQDGSAVLVRADEQRSIDTISAALGAV